MISRHPYGNNTKESIEGEEMEGKEIPGVGSPLSPEAMSVFAISLTTNKVIYKYKHGFQIGQMIEGEEVFKQSDPSQACGTIVNVAQINESNSLALIEMSMADQEQGGIHCGSIEGPVATLLPLPYAITDITR